LRVADRALPTVTSHGPISSFASMKSWPMRPVIAVETRQTLPTWDDPLMTWDDATIAYDTPTVATPWSDLACDYTGLILEAGNPDARGNFDAARALVQVDNRAGTWSRYNVDGSLTDYGPGRILAIWATDDTSSWWLFYGRIARWDELADDVIEIEAFDAFSDLAQLAASYTPGVVDQTAGPRIAAIANGAGGYTDRSRLDAGTCRLSRQVTERAPLEELQIVAASDGGIAYVDADGTLLYRARDWRAGRSDQVTVPVLSDNVCTAPIVVWDAQLSTNDDGLADTVILENVAGLRATASNPRPAGAYRIAETDQQWNYQIDGDTLAAFMVSVAPARLAVDQFVLYLLDPHQATLWRAVDYRIGDRARFLHESKTPGGVAVLDLAVVLQSLAHDVTPGGQWVMTCATTKAVDYVRPIAWDETWLVWDDTAAAAVWGY
jgi:hypothetical protein